MVVTVQICALLWKNLKTKTRSPGTIIGEIVIPILMCALIANEKLISHKTKGVKRYEPHSVSANLSNDRLVELVYVPTSPAIRKLLLSSNSTATIFKKLISFKSVNEAYKYTSKKYLSYPPVKFDLDNISEVPTRLSYKVILDVDYEPGYQSAEAIQYMDFCVTVLQTEISRAFTSYWAARRSISVEYGKLMIQRMPETTSISTTGIETKYVLYVFWPLMYVWLFTITINYLVNDRKYMIKISLSMLGVTDKVFWLSWFITSLTSGVIVAVIVTITYCTDYSEDGQVIETKASLFAIIQLVYIINTISSAFLLSHVIFFVEELVFALSLVYYVSCTVLSLSAVTYFLSRVQMFIIGTFLYQTGFYIVVQDIYNKEYLGII
ncbi:ATP-binding cassette sub-family A member 17-like [Physella acuta]|uniref:ATP-binding cassette sub-family A member 17-like n=1 Tax=Physella acuta TaxID=109671 RepID=UPI0027DC2BDC|nr:ATP-binding cassette sub-family A member 17-like [Physella acuta]